MDSTKLIIGILIVVFFVVKTIIGDAKKDKAKKVVSQQPKKPKTVFPSFFFDDEQVVNTTNNVTPPLYTKEGVSETIGDPATIMPGNELSEEQQKAHTERWRQAVIDSEILKTKF